MKKHIAQSVIAAGLLLGVTSAASAQTAPVATAQARGASASHASAEDGIRAMLDKQAVDWNRGDIEAFATGYKNSPDILFIGSKVRRGYAQMLAGYKTGYPPERMGRLTYSNLEVQPLDSRFATVTGEFALARAKEHGGDSAGSFLLVVEKTPAGWKIVRDDTTAAPAVK